MRVSRLLETRQFLTELKNLKILHVAPNESVLERLERERILVPRLRLRYPDSIERRWFAEGRRRPKPLGRLEPNGSRWKEARALEHARQRLNWPRNEDPLEQPNPLDDPRSEWRQFIQHPSRRKFVDWSDFRVRVDCKDGPTWHSDTVVTYYSAWQVLLFLECHDMGTSYFGNTDGWDWISGKIPETWTGGGINFEPIRSLRTFRRLTRQLDAVVWFAEEDARNDNYVLRHTSGRRLIEEQELEDMEQRSIELAKRCRSRFRVSYPQIITLIKFLCERWGDWARIGYSNHAQVYKSFIGHAIALARHLRNVAPARLFSDVGRVTGHFKPTLQVIFQDWAAEWREDAERLITSFARPGSILKADFTAEQANAFLDFVEEHDLFEFYWRWRSLNERAFSGDSRHLAGLKSDLQGMALSVEHIVHALLARNTQHPKSQLYEKFKQLWPASSSVGKLLRTSEYRDVAYRTGVIDLDWFDAKQERATDIQIASDLALCHAIRGNAHHQVAETNQLRLERMSIVLLRGVMRAFIEASRRWPIDGASDQ